MKKQLVILLLILPLSMTLNACEKESIKVVNEEYASERVLNSDEEETKKEDYPTAIGEAASLAISDKKIREKENFPPDTNPDNIPKTKILWYYNSQSCRDESIEGILVEKGIDDSVVWNEIRDFEWTFESKIKDNKEWNFGDKEIKLDMNSKEPKWRGCEEDIAEILEIKNTDYSLESAKWVTDYYEIDGVWKRKAKYSINSKKKGYYAIYEGIGKEYTYNESVPQESEDKDLLSLYKDYNEDVYGLITIKDTKLNHPIMRSDYDEDFYLWHDLNKNYNSHGIPFITLESNLDCSHGNNMIYGHRLNDGDVFGELTNYSSIEYFKKHPVIETVTEKGNSKWIIFAYFLACSEDEDSFDYFEKYRFESKKDFDEYMTEVDKRNQLSVPVKKDVTDAYLTLSSCSKEKTGRGNRMVVMAKRINDDFDVKECVQKSSQNENALLPKTLR